MSIRYGLRGMSSVQELLLNAQFAVVEKSLPFQIPCWVTLILRVLVGDRGKSLVDVNGWSEYSSQSYTVSGRETGDLVGTV
jgi:hypothetical protein